MQKFNQNSFDANCIIHNLCYTHIKEFYKIDNDGWFIERYFKNISDLGEDMELPSDFMCAMQALLGAEYTDYIKCMQKPRKVGIRVNTRKISPERFQKAAPFHLTRIPFIPNGFYYDESDEPSKHPYYYAGLYYLQEPSAMLPAQILPIEAGDKVLDLCAAPGGKSTELGAKLCGTGVLYANDISASRAKALLKNLEMHGIANCYVTAEEPQKLASHFHEYFDKILVDAPCSGEGMFRKEPSLIKSYEERGPYYYAPIQRQIVKEAVKMLKPGGMLLYSTCTFSKVEDEDTVQYILDEYPEMMLLKATQTVNSEGFREGIAPLNDCIRIYPHKVDGEGHFIALLQKKKMISEVEAQSVNFSNEDIHLNEDITQIQNCQYKLPEGTQIIKGLRYLRTGLLLGELDKKGILQPSQAYAMSFTNIAEYDYVLNLHADDIRVVKYLKGETISVTEDDIVKDDIAKDDTANTKNTNKTYLICVDNYPLGWGKLNGNMLKNKYTPAWRMQ